MEKKELLKLLIFDIKEPNRKELEDFKRNYLEQQGKLYIAKKALEHITKLELYIIQLYDRLVQLNKFSKEEFKEFAVDMDNRRKEYNKLNEEIRQLNQALDKARVKIRKYKDRYGTV